MKCVIVDDEPLARECISKYVSRIDYLELLAEVTNPIELTAIVASQPVDLIYLDIQTPVINGIDYLRIANNPPMVIITTAYPNFALEGFQLDVMDYLLKPITFDRFLKATGKANDHFNLLKKTAVSDATTNDYFFIKCDSKFERIHYDDILYIQALENYVHIVTAKRKYLTLLNLKSVEENLANHAFMKVHKSFLVATSKIEAIENNDILIHGTRVPIGRHYREEVIDRVLHNKLWKKNRE
ncbi:LytR/AlgR family response regulator transcription factor [Pseudochryseolinea flava]|uniref:DNA-binding response regulator n=1 Tax=Pseudochryseolinea flava TaxID=2059302 RepID=A0A364Y2K9_9BACT|nr:LytTR family DNA-binding domain-containing protein [Pseudochryseolinea flava]RAW01113.1 DNA-binding response regulator [Pseudochryseolinea flava]